MLPQVPARPYAWPHDDSLSPSNTALLVIDMQRDFLEEGGYLTAQGYDPLPLRKVIEPIMALLRAFSLGHYPVFWTRESHRPDLSTLSSRELHRSRLNPSNTGIGDRTRRLGCALVRGQPGAEIIPELARLTPQGNVIDKPGRSAFAHTDLELMLRNKGIKNLVICGVTTDVCVHSTMREANDRGFDCCLVEDACAAGTKELHEWAIESILGEGGIFGCVAGMEDMVMTVGHDVLEANPVHERSSDKTVTDVEN